VIVQYPEKRNPERLTRGSGVFNQAAGKVKGVARQKHRTPQNGGGSIKTEFA